MIKIIEIDTKIATAALAIISESKIMLVSCGDMMKLLVDLIRF
jgi:hypothetical protein